MYDFCLTFPYAALLGLGGLVGFFTKGSLPSLLGGVGSAMALALAGHISLQQYNEVMGQSRGCFATQKVQQHGDVLLCAKEPRGDMLAASCRASCASLPQWHHCWWRSCSRQ